MTAFADIQERALVRCLKRPAALVAEMPELIREVIEDLEVSKNFRVNELFQVFITAEPAQLLTSDFGGMQRTGTHNVPRFIDTRSRPWYTNGDGSERWMEWLPTDIAQRPGFYGSRPDEIGPPRFLEIAQYDFAENVSDINLGVWPIPDGLSPAGDLSSDGEYQITVPYYRRLDLAADDSNAVNWFLNNCREHIVAAAASKGCFFNRDRDEALVQGAIAASALKKLVHKEKVRKIKQRTLRPSMGANAVSMRHGSVRGRPWGYL